MLTSSSLPDYLRKLARAPIESCLVRLADAVNAEVAAGPSLPKTLIDVEPFSVWLPYDQAQEDPRMGDRDTLLRQAARKLDEARMCRYDKRSGALTGTDVGRVALLPET